MWELNHRKGWRPGTDAFEMWCWMTLEHPLNCKEMKSANPKGNQPWIFTGCTDAEAEAPIIWPPDAKSLLLRKDPDGGKDWGQEAKGVTEIEMVGWHHWRNGHEFEQTQGDSEGRGKCVMLPFMGSQRIRHDVAKEQHNLILLVHRTNCQRF